MKKIILKRVLPLLAVAFIGIFFAISCEKEKQVPSCSIMGSWRCVDTRYNHDEQYLQLQFDNNGKMHVTNTTSIESVFDIHEGADYEWINDRLLYIGQYLHSKGHLSKNKDTLYLEYNGGISAGATGPSSFYTFKNI